MIKPDITLARLKQACKRYSYSLPQDGSIFTFGIRNSNLTAGIFNDFLGIYHIKNGKEIMMIDTGTVDPGSYYLINPMHPLGTAVLKAGLHLDAYAKGYHKDYKALVQVGAMGCYRITPEHFKATNKDNPKGEWVIDLKGLQPIFNVTGCNQHRASAYSILEDIGLYGAACQVRNNPKEYSTFIDTVWASKQKMFDYGLFLEKDLFGIGDMDTKSERRV